MPSRVTTLILPVAGKGRRLRPLTNRRPKALVPINGGPMLEYALYEAAASGITKAVLVVSPQHESHFRAYVKKNAGKLARVGIQKVFIRVQKKAMGDGHAVAQALDLVGKNEPVAVRFCDDLLLDEAPTLGGLLEFYKAYGDSAILLERVPRRLVSRYGVCGVRPAIKNRNLPRGKFYRISTFVEKPSPQEAPSNLIVIGGYVLTPAFLGSLKRAVRRLKTDADDALRLADVFREELQKKRKVYGWEFTGHRLDCGTLEGFHSAEKFLAKNIRYQIGHPQSK